MVIVASPLPLDDTGDALLGSALHGAQQHRPRLLAFNPRCAAKGEDLIRGGRGQATVDVADDGRALVVLLSKSWQARLRSRLPTAERAIEK